MGGRQNLMMIGVVITLAFFVLVNDSIPHLLCSVLGGTTFFFLRLLCVAINKYNCSFQD